MVVNEFYEILQKALKKLTRNYILIVMGDFNAKIGEGAQGTVFGRFGLGVRNEAGDCLLDFSRSNDLTNSNTCFKQHPRRQYTWTSRN